MNWRTNTLDQREGSRHADSNWAHQQMDDMADFAASTPFQQREGGCRLDTRRPFIPQGCDQQGRLTPTIQPAEAATEIGCEDESISGYGVATLVMLGLSALVVVIALGRLGAWLAERAV